MSSAEKRDLDLISNVDTDDSFVTMDFTLSDQLDIEVYKLEEMVKCLENLERALEPRGENNQTTRDNCQLIAVIHNQVT
jgi:hypothetical protein